MGAIASLACSQCAQHYPPDRRANLCVCGGPLLVQYDLNALGISNPQALVSPGVSGMWRYEKVLPADAAEAVTLGEGWTPLIRLKRLADELGAHNLWLKDEGRNPTDSFKARGLSAAVTMAKKLGVAKLAIPSAGNAASALAAYASAAGLEAHIFMPSDVPQANFVECKAYGAKVTLVDGLINDCGRIVAERKSAEGWFDISTLREPYRIEGKKTMGYEVAEQFGWQLPDSILYPCGGGVGLIGMWKAFAELETLGITGSKRPKMIAVQAAGCGPLARAFEAGAPRCELWNNAYTIASGLRVPKPLGDFLILKAIRESRGTVVSVTDEDMLDAGILLAEREGIFPAPEGGACVAAAAQLLKTAFLKPAERIVIYNTGSGLKYLEAYTTRFPRRGTGEHDKLGGLITPR